MQQATPPAGRKAPALLTAHCSTAHMQSKVKSRKWLYHIALFNMEYPLLGRSRRGVGAGVAVDIFRPESESESLEIHRLRSPALRGRVRSGTQKSLVLERRVADGTCTPHEPPRGRKTTTTPNPHCTTASADTFDHIQIASSGGAARRDAPRPSLSALDLGSPLFTAPGQEMSAVSCYGAWVLSSLFPSRSGPHAPLYASQSR